MAIRFFHPRHNGQWPSTSKDFYTRSYPLQYVLILILEKEPVFPFPMLSAKQGNYWYHFYNVFGMTRSLTGDWTRDLPHSKPALYHKVVEEAVTVPIIQVLCLTRLRRKLFVTEETLYSYITFNQPNLVINVSYTCFVWNFIKNIILFLSINFGTSLWFSNKTQSPTSRRSGFRRNVVFDIFGFSSLNLSYMLLR